MPANWLSRAEWEHRPPLAVVPFVMTSGDEALGALTTVFVALVARLKAKGILSQDEIRVMFDSILLELEESELAAISDVRGMHGIISHLQAVLDPAVPRKELG